MTALIVQSKPGASLPLNPTLAFPSRITAGNTLVVLVAQQSASRLSSPTDSGGNIFRDLWDEQMPTAGLFAACFAATAAASRNDTVTIPTSAASVFAIAEISGLPSPLTLSFGSAHEEELGQDILYPFNCTNPTGELRFTLCATKAASFTSGPSGWTQLANASSGGALVQIFSEIIAGIQAEDVTWQPSQALPTIAFGMSLLS